MLKPILFSAALVAAGPSFAATFYSDATAFGAATTGAVETVLPNLGNSGLSETIGDLAFTSQSGSLFFGGSLDWSSLLAGNDLAISAPESFTISFASAVTAFSMEVHEPTGANGPVTESCNAPSCVDTTFRMELLDGMAILDSYTFNPADDAVEFVGATSLSAFSAVRIVDVTNNLDNEYFNAFTTASIAPVPLPAGLPLLLAGLSGLFALRRKHS